MGEIIKVENLVQRVKSRTLLNEVSFSVHQGQSLGLFGPRGAGKTSLLHILAGIDRFVSGTVEVLGQDVSRTEKFKGKIGIVTQVPSLFKDFSGYENLDFLACLKGVSKEYLQEILLNLELEDSLKQRAGKMLPGTYARLSLACALLGNPSLLLLDNFAENLDVLSLRLITTELRRFQDAGGTVVIAADTPEFLCPVHEVGFMEEGRLELLDPEAATALWQAQRDYIAGGRGHDA